ncbi:uncharacterized protein K460DRAFT_407435 [Cucurbitaria berberidis CBS 394.84]|uniref:Uncharacterized protein n=1 Tax=Cucurbitaria berberidis CBS 394.84 TaxID=1168544 RepID=A0A9P4GBZ5_9PLEO|nr:uncharacterized protein K460DRAFT_407435 [Cucurbitaria berberidis CBS 394.84]KAF1843063.1 hypothetical protein K460DRAFT_407435 [Cucurbitaria berberidis CBS 394.84]
MRATPENASNKKKPQKDGKKLEAKERREQKKRETQNKKKGAGRVITNESHSLVIALRSLTNIFINTQYQSFYNKYHTYISLAMAEQSHDHATEPKDHEASQNCYVHQPAPPRRNRPHPKEEEDTDSEEVERTAREQRERAVAEYFRSLLDQAGNETSGNEQPRPTSVEAVVSNASQAVESVNEGVEGEVAGAANPGDTSGMSEPTKNIQNIKNGIVVLRTISKWADKAALALEKLERQDASRPARDRQARIPTHNARKRDDAGERAESQRVEKKPLWL